jgi:hypothetical protein
MKGSKRMSITEVAAELGISDDAARANVRSGAIPGGDLIYRTETGRQRWLVDRAVFETWRAANAAPAANTALAAPAALSTPRRRSRTG